MTSTNDTDTKISTLFNEYIAVNTGSTAYLKTSVDKEATSYYELPQHEGQAYFSFIDTTTEENFATYLATFWSEMGSEEFAGMSKDLSALAFSLGANHDTQSEDVSPFVYTMY